MAATWDSLHKAAQAAIQSQIDAASVTWADLNDAPAMWILRVRSSWWAVGKSENEIVAEAKRRFQEAQQDEQQH